MEKIYVCEWAERASLEKFRIYTFQNCMFVGYLNLLHLYIQCSFPFIILLMTWHFKRLTIKAGKICTASEEYFRIPTFQTSYFFSLFLWVRQTFCRYMTFNLEIGRGGGTLIIHNTGHPPPQILGGGYIPYTGPFSWGGGGGGHTHFCPNLLSLPESRICLGNAFLAHMGEGEEKYSFEVIGYRKQ